MQRKWRRAWLRGKPHYMRYKPVRKAHTGSIKAKVYDLTIKAAKKLAPAAAAAGIFLSSLTGVQANPTGGSITAGTGSITGQGTNHVTINQTSDKLAVNWNSFSIGSGEKVQFIQPGASSIALNRVLGNNASAIYGQLSANGKVFLLNPNGVLFAQGAQVNVGGLVASTLKLSDQDFMNGKYSFSGDSQQGVLNQGSITVANGGYAALLGANAANEGVILAKEGTVAMGAGSKILLDFTGDGLLTLSVDESKVKAEVKNSGLIKADGGLVVMNAKAADALTGSVVNNTGTIEAKSIISKNGAIILTGDTVTNAGTLDASGKHADETGGTVKVLGDTVRLAAGAAIDVSGDSGGGTALIGGAYQGGASEYAATKMVIEQGTSINADALTTGNGGQVVVWANDTTSFAGSISAKGGKNSGDGGSVETSGKKTLTVADTASVNTTAAQGKTGNWLLDPLDFTVGTGTTGDNYWNNGDLQTALSSTNVTITTTQNENTAGSNTYNTTSRTGNGDINILAPVSWNANKLTLSSYRNINIKNTLSATGTAALEMTSGTGGSGTIDYGLTASGFTGKVNFNRSGSGFLTINNTPYTVIASLGVANSKTGTDLQGMEGNLNGNYFLGADIDASTTSAWNPWSSGSGYFGFDPIGDYNIDFAGRFDGGGHTIRGLTINRNGYSGLFASTGASADIRNVGLVDGSVTGSSNSSNVGGLVGFNSGSITNSYNSGSVNGTSFVGGLVGYQESGSITNSYNSGIVNGSSSVGGLAGISYISSITNSYNNGIISGISGVGGLAGSASGSITNSYNSGNVSGSSSIGGLAGSASGSITNSYNIGSVSGSVDGDVSGSSNVGGLAGSTSIGSIIENSYNSGSVTGDDMVGGLAGNDYFGKITNSYNSGSVTGSTDVGGIGGYYTGGITNSYNSGSVTGVDKVGGLVGRKSPSGNIKNSYNSGSVAGSTAVGGIVGSGSSSITDSFYATTDASGGSINNGGAYDSVVWSGNANGTGKTLSKLQSASFWTSVWGENMDTVGGADKIWRIYDGHTTPLLKCFLKQTTVNADNKSKTYDGAVYSGSPTSVTYAPGTDFSLLLGTDNPTYGNARNAGTYGLSLYSVQHGYDIVYETGMLTINKANLIASLTGTATKTYNGNNSGPYLTPSNYSLSGLVEGDTVNISGTATYDNKNVGTGKLVTASELTLGGTDAGNYNLTSSTATGNIGAITPKTLTTYLTNSVTKTYDGSNSATLADSNYYLWGVVSGDTVNVSGTATYNDKNAGMAKTVTASGLNLGGADAGNYNLTSSTVTANIGKIMPKTLTTSLTGTVTKTYDGSSSATLADSNYSLLGLVSGDTVNVSGTTTYDDKNAGTGKTVMASGLNLGGTDAGNYNLTSSTATANIGEITSKTLTTALTGTVTKTYDGNNSATLADSNYSLSGLVSGDTVNVSGMATYNDKNAGTGKTVTASGLNLGGTDAGNYNLTSSTATANIGEITPKTLTTALTGSVEKVYDGTATATLTNANYSALSGIIGSDTVSLTIANSGSYDNKNVGENKEVTVSGLSLSGASAGNYQLASTSLSSNIGAIDKAALTITAAANTKTYDGTTTAAATPTYSGLQTGDSITGLAEVYTDKNAGSGKTLQVSSGYTLNDNNNGNNYTVTLVENTSGVINKSALTVTAKNAEKIQDKLAYAGGNGVTFDGFVNSESSDVLNGSLAYGGTAQGATEVGTYILTPTGLTSTNYTITFKDGTLKIKPAPKPAPKPTPQSVTQPQYVAAVESARQAPATAPSRGTDSPRVTAANSASAANTPQAAGSQPSNIQYRSDGTGPARTITNSGQSITIAPDSLVHLQLDAVQKDIPVYQSAGGSLTPATIYRLDNSQGSLTLREGGANVAPLSPNMSAPGELVPTLADTSSFQLTDSQGSTVNFTIAYVGGSLYVQAPNEAATDMMRQNQMLVTAASLVAAQDKLGIDTQVLKAVYLAK